MSPLAMTGIATVDFTARMVSYSTGPTKPQARVRPCTASAAMPASSAIRAIAVALRSAGDQPVRILSVTGTSTAATTARTIAATRASSRRSADPAATLQTFFAGQPMLMSMICAPRSTLRRAAAAIWAGSAPAICTTMGPDSPRWSVRRSVLPVSRSSGFAATISDTA